VRRRLGLVLPRCAWSRAALGSEARHDRTPTIYDVARVAGVSIASVSRVLNGRNNPREETRERVLRAVAELGFARTARPGRCLPG
jgi:transcriptional regulator with XRE-family HTH domain